MSTPNMVTFKNIPVGGPYFAFIQALDENGNVLNESQNNLNYSLSTNSLIVNSDLSLDLPLGYLQVNLLLRNSKPSDVNFKIDNSSDIQTNSRLNLDRNGNGLIVWTNSKNNDRDIYAQKMTAYNKIGLPFRVNSTNLENQEQPSISLNSEGSGIITWKSFENSMFLIEQLK
jgi:hypothetical protein